MKRERCKATWGLVERVQCRRNDGHDGLHSGDDGDGRRMVW